MLYIIYTIFNKGLSEGMLFPYPKSEVKIAINYRKVPLFCRSEIFGMYTKDVRFTEWKNSPDRFSLI